MTKEKEIQKIVPDTSILIQGKLSALIESGELKDADIIIPEMVLDELQAQASRGKDIGFEGLEEIKKIRELGKDKGIKIEFSGRRPTLEEINLAKKGRIDALIRDAAKSHRAVLYTSDYVQALIGEVEGVQIKYIPQPLRVRELILEKFFTEDTQSVHLKEGVVPVAKKGKPGQISLVKIREEPITEAELNDIINQIVLKARSDKESNIEMGLYGAMVIQLRNYRIAITKPPFSDAVEVTAVRPTTKVNLESYKLHKEIEKKIVEQSAGVLIAGPPGSGKSTFAASISDFISSKNKIVKTFEQPRDLQVGKEVTQYAPLEGSWEKTSEILLLVRPDYTIFDEIRKTQDFRVFADMRLAGVGMVGVMHATDPINAIQRFIGRIELGTIPHVIDIVIYIKDGQIKKVLELSMSVKVPSGMVEADLARPVVEVRDFETKNLEFEIYSYGEENVVMPVKEDSKESGVKELAKAAVYREVSRFDRDAKVSILSDDRVLVKIRNEAIAGIIGKKGSNIELLEKKLGVSITVEPKDETFKKEVEYGMEESGAHFTIFVDQKYTGEMVDIYSGDDFVLSSTVGKKGKISINKKSDVGSAVLQALTINKLRVLV